MQNSTVNFRRIELMKCIKNDNILEIVNLFHQMSTCDFCLRNNNTPIHTCIEQDKLGSLMVLLGAHKATVSYAPNQMEPPLVYALQHKNDRISLLLLKYGADPRSRSRSRNWNRNPAIFYCCMYKELYSVFEEIVKRCPDALFDLNSARFSCLLVAADFRQHRILRLLCAPFKITLRLLKISNINGINALMVSCFRGDQEGFDILYNLIPFYDEDYMGGCALSYVITGNHFPMFLDIVKRECVRRDGHLEHCMGNCLSGAIQCKKLDVAKYIVNIMENVSDWINYVTHSSIMHSLAAFGNAAMVQVVFPFINKLSVESVDAQKNTPLMIAIYYRNSYMVNLILEKCNVDLTHTNVFGFTPKHIATMLKFEI